MFRISLAVCLVILNLFSGAAPAPLPIQPPYAIYFPLITHEHAPLRILWVEDCVYHPDPSWCHLGNSNDLAQFNALINSLGATLEYRMPLSVADLRMYDVVIANYCSMIYDEGKTALLDAYIASGGSVIVLGDNFCIVGAANGKNVSAADAANELTQSRGLHFTVDDDSSVQWSDSILPHPITTGILSIYSYRHAYLDISGPSQLLVSMNGRGFIGVYDHEGTIVAIPNVGFHWGNIGDVSGSDNFKFWRLMLTWLADQTVYKPPSLPPQ